MARFRYQRGERPLDGYSIEHGLGVGGFGEVYFAVSDSGREVALKAVQNYQEIELRGIRQCMNLKSPHLVTIFDVRHNDRDDPFVIMEYVQGPSLHHLLENTEGGLGETKAAFFLREIAKGLTYLHDHGVVHRDLKPHNVFYEEGYVKIGDYSLCKLISTTQHSGHTMTVGSVHYMAPEISKGQYDARVDIYALGVMLYELLTGVPPFFGESIGEILMKHLNEEPDLSRVNEPFRQVISQAMAKNPDDRFQSASEMVAAVYGNESVENSVVAFNPQELTMVAERVVSQAPNFSEDKNGSGPGGVGFESGDASAWKRGDLTSDSDIPIAERADSPVDSPMASVALADTDAAKQTVVEPSGQVAASSLGRDSQRKTPDRMPTVVRWGLGIAAATVISFSVNEGLLALNQNGLHLQRSQFGIWVFSLIMFPAAVFVLLQDSILWKASRLLVVRYLWTVIGLLLVAPAAIAACFHFVGADTLFGYREAGGFSFAGLLPFALLPVWSFTSPNREKRFSVRPLIYGILLAFGFSWCFDVSAFGYSWAGWASTSLYVVPMAVTAGLVTVLQIVSPKATAVHRVAGANYE